MRWPVATIWGIAIVSSLGLWLIGVSYDPLLASRPVKVLFLILLFFAIMSLVAVVLYAIDVIRIEGRHHFFKAYFGWEHSYINIALRRGVIVGLVLISMVILERFRVLNLYSTGVILIAGSVAEIFLMKED